MATLAKLVVKLITDATDFTSGMEAASKQLGKMGQSMASAGDKMTVGLTLPIVAAGAAAVKFASDLEETRNKTKVVFGDMSKAVFDFADNSAREMGMSENAALSAAATFGNLFTSMGMGQGAAAEMSTGLVQLAADLASFNNLNPEEVFIKLRSGIVGEVEPLRALGINLSAAAVEAKAMQMGLVDANGELSEQAKIAARYAIIMEQTSNAQGDFARTSDGLANSTRILKAQLEDTMASFGEELIPAVTTALKALIPILEWFNNLPDSVKSGIVYLLMFVAALGPILTIGGKVLGVLGGIGGLVGGGGAVSAGLGSLSTFITATVTPALGGLAAAIGAISAPVWLLIAAIGALIVVLIKFGPEASKTISMLVQIFAAGFERIKYEVMQFFINLAGAFARGYAEMRQAGGNLVQGIWAGIQSGWQWLLNMIQTNLNNLLTWVKNILGIKSPSKVFAEKVGKQMALGIGVGFEAGMKNIQPSMNLALQPSFQAPALAANIESVRPGSASQAITVGPITINGDLSKSAKERLKREIYGMFTNTLTDALR